MKINRFTATEVQMICSPWKITGRSLLKYTLIDLTWLQYLSVYREWRIPHYNDRERLYSFVTRGKYFYEYRASAYFDPFIAHLRKQDEYYLLDLVRKVNTYCHKGPGFKRDFVYPELVTRKIFRSSLVLKYLNIFRFSTEGKTIREQITAQLQHADLQFGNVPEGSPETVRKFVNDLGPSVIHLRSLNDKSLPLVRAKLETAYQNISTEDNASSAHLKEPGFLLLNFIRSLSCFDDSVETFLRCLDFDSMDFGEFGDQGFTGFRLPEME